MTADHLYRWKLIFYTVRYFSFSVHKSVTLALNCHYSEGKSNTGHVYKRI